MKRTTVFLTDQQKDKLTSRAQGIGIPMAELLRRLIDERWETITVHEKARLTVLEKLLWSGRRLHAIAAKMDPDDPELATIEDGLDEAQQVITELKRLMDEGGEEDV